MNDEIKHEIFMMYDLAGDKDLIYYEAIQRIIDYIADLEKENEKLKNIISSVKEDFLNANNELTNLQQENKYLDELRNANYLSWQDSLSKIEKAIEFINEYAKYNKITINQNKYYGEYILNNVIDILNGRSDE